MIPEVLDRLYPDPADCCVSCDGRGFHRFYDSDCGNAHERCFACEGEARTGVFVLRLSVAGHAVERTWHTRSFEVAVARGTRFAALLARVLRFWDVRAEVHVIFIPHESDGELEVVHASAVQPRRVTPRAPATRARR